MLNTDSVVDKEILFALMSVDTNEAPSHYEIVNPP